MNFLLAEAGLFLPDDGTVIAMRSFDLSFVYFDIAFLCIFIGLLLWKKKYMTLIVGLLAGILYFAVDYGVFYAAYGERHIYFNGVPASPGVFFAILFWMSMSYGFTNFTWIWLWMAKDRDLFEWSLLILSWWFVGPMLMDKFNTGANIVTFRSTLATHGGMAIMFFIGYIFIIIWNMAHSNKKHRVNILWIAAIGILVQFGWELGLLLGGIRSDGRTPTQKLMTVVVNSLLETNLGMPYTYFLYILYSSRFTENLRKKIPQMTFLDRMAENNAERVRKKQEELPLPDSSDGFLHM